MMNLLLLLLGIKSSIIDETHLHFTFRRGANVSEQLASEMKLRGWIFIEQMGSNYRFKKDDETLSKTCELKNHLFWECR